VNSKFFTTAYILLLISIGYIATDIYLPSLPAISTYFNASENDAQMTLFSYLLSFSMTPLIFGPLSDHLGRKKVLLGGMIVCIIATLGCLFAQNIYWLIAFRFFQGIGAGAVLIATRATVSDLFVGKALVQQMSFMTMLMPIVLAIAPTLGGALQEAFEWQSVFVFLVFYMMLLLAFISLRSETLQKTSHEDISQIFSKYQAHLKNRKFLIYGINFILPSLGIFAYMTVSPFLFQEVIGLSPAEYGSLAVYVGLTILVAGYINLKLIHYYTLSTLIAIGSILVLLAGFLLMSFHFLNILTTWSLLIPFLIFFICMPFCVTNSASKCMMLIKHNFGAATALLSTMQFLVGALATLFFSLMSDETALSLAVCYIIVGTASLINLCYACKLESISEN
jgi:DHA1 family 2-module integral membrane pump EmrD-like MFS transporter